MVNIFIIKLQKNKYYIGKTTKPNFDIKKHFNADDLDWTIKYKPLELVEFITNCHEDSENDYIFKYISKYGLNNVRGGEFNSCKINISEKDFFEEMFNDKIDKCFICGSDEHTVSECNNEDCFENNEIFCCHICNEEFQIFNDLLMHQRTCKSTKCEKCTKCGKYNHNARRCPSKLKPRNTNNKTEFFYE